jgi:hypothetical protein
MLAAGMTRMCPAQVPATGHITVEDWPVCGRRELVPLWLRLVVVVARDVRSCPAECEKRGAMGVPHGSQEGPFHEQADVPISID